MRHLLLSFAAMASVLFTGCEKPENTLRTLQDGVSSYASKPSDEAAAKIDANFTKLDAQIADLRGSGKTDQAESIAQQRDALQAQYAAARMTASLLKAKEAAANVGEAFRKVGEALSQTLKGASTNQE
jgi:major membrane immunogen (membrane-anchored lipoprotein)